MSDTAPRPRLTRNTKIVIGLVVLILWTIWASNWHDKGCDLVPQSYAYVIQYGSPDSNEGCDDEPSGARYTDDYQG